jgi:quercetin dioxygenase-like cupin family protein
MAKVFTKKQLPHFDSTRDTRDRLDLVKDNQPIENPKLWADRIIYHPGDTCAKHYHIGSHHLFVVLEGEGWIFTLESSHRLKPGMVAAVRPEEVHWFENDTDDNLKFVEFWAPPPQETIWIVDDDI